MKRFNSQNVLGQTEPTAQDVPTELVHQECILLEFSNPAWTIKRPIAQNVQGILRTFGFTIADLESPSMEVHVFFYQFRFQTE